MTMFRIKTRNQPRGKFVRDSDAASADGCVRVYQCSPDEIALQLWSGKRYMMVALFPAEARDIAEQLIRAQLRTKALADSLKLNVGGDHA